MQNLEEYHRPQSVEEAVRLLRRGGSGTAILGGGTELTGAERPLITSLIDLAGAGLNQIEAEAARLKIGAMVTLRQLEAAPAVRALAGGIVSRAVRQSAPATIRMAATLGGTLSGRKGGDEIPTVLLALGATVTLAYAQPRSKLLPGAVAAATREMPLGAFLANREASVAGAVLTHVTIPIRMGTARGGLAMVSPTPSARAIMVAAATVTPDGTQAVALGGLALFPRLVEPGHQLWEVIDDHRASAAYRREVAPVLIRRALEEAGCL